MSYTLRKYQNDATDVIVRYFRDKYNKPIIIQAASGSGKSLIIAETCHRLNEPVLILQPSKELLSQNHEKLLSYGVTDIGIYSASKKSKEVSKYTFATIGSIYKKPELFQHFKYILIDEAALVNPKNLGGMYLTFFNAINCKKIVGLTASPYRLTQKYHTNPNGEMVYTSQLSMLNRIFPFFFTKIAFKIETQELIDQGYLCPIVYHTEDTDWDELKINTTGADFTTDTLEKYWNNKRLTKLAEIIEHINYSHKLNLIFCSSIRQAERTKELIEDKGMDCAIVTSQTPAKERDEIVQRFRDGKLKHLINVNCFSHGLDIPQLDSVVLARPTISLALYYQQLCRGVRLDPDNPKKKLHVYDVAGVVERMGKVETIRLAKEDGWKDKVVSEVGDMSGKPLFSFKVKRDIFKKKSQPEKLSPNYPQAQLPLL